MVARSLVDGKPGTTSSGCFSTARSSNSSVARRRKRLIGHPSLPGREQTTSELALTPAGREGVGDLKPGTVAADTMVGAHAGALAFVPLRFLARSRADLLLAIRLDDVDLAVALQRPINEVVEPRLRQLPIGLRAPIHSGAVRRPFCSHCRLSSANGSRTRSFSPRPVRRSTTGIGFCFQT